MFAGNFAPAGWMFCEGQLLPISEYETLFNLIGTTYGGDGQSTFALPDLRGRIPLHMGNGAEQITLTVPQIPAHTHPFLASTATSTGSNPQGNVNDQNVTIQIYTQGSSSDNLNPGSVTSTGGSQPHNNFQPYLCVDFIISLFGIFPSQT
jgi:microcystin-dependent protein